MSGETLRDRVRPLLDQGLTNQEIAAKLGEPLRRIQTASYVIRNAAYVAQQQREYGRERYGTPAYRKWDRERRRRKYAVDEFFRQGVKDAVKRYRKQRKARAEGASA